MISLIEGAKRDRKGIPRECQDELNERCLRERGGVLVSSLNVDGEVVEGLVEVFKCWPLLGHLPPTLEHQLVE